ncbi:hypothetical protein D9757_001289 [Collybiopsis confluens]|uniref:DNA mismatch repair protein S5 domain-containing protein n=1 Tax=Collybiopsis confluens TaxID=2823264 RepID=A0A8H5I0W8_9AGAR|nr:hypothetical protein D9757_001289 [Collybiopsis confluens]
MADPFIEPLSSSTRAKLRSTQILTSLTQIVSELLQNSLDAGARNIDIGVNCAQWTCWVTDDGSGMTKESLNILGTEGRYNTSKAYSPDSLNYLSSFGFRGEALASAADLCCLEIASRTSLSRETWSIILKDENVFYTGPAVRWRRESPGTTVCVRDAFYNLPVRRRSHPSASRTLELVRQEVELWALMHPHVSFMLENSQTKLSGSSARRILKIPRTSSTISVFRHLYGRALCEHLEDIKFGAGDMKLEGFISLEGALSKAYQFLYINRHPIPPGGELHRVIDTRFASSSFAKNAYDEIGETRRSSSRRSPRKAEKKPVYVLNLVIPIHQVDNLLEPAKAALHFQVGIPNRYLNKTAVSEFLSSSIKSFLVRHDFLVQWNTSSTHESSQSPLKRKRLDFEHNSGYAELMPEESEDEMADVLPQPLNLYAEKTLGAEEAVWTDPNTRESFIVNRRTGNSRPRTQHRPGDIPENSVFRQRRTLSLPVFTDKSRAGPAPEWIQEALEANDTYGITERRITEVSIGGAEVQQSQKLRLQRFSKLFLSGQCNGDFDGIEQQRFTKDDIRSARIISQVDRKFIACVFKQDLPGGDLGIQSVQMNSENSALHAADERIRVERFLRELCLGFLRCGSNVEGEGVERRHLTPPVPVLLTRLETSRLAKSQEIQRRFESWGICFTGLAEIEALNVSANKLDEANGGYAQVLVEYVPEVVADKLTMGNELRDLVKGYLAQLETNMPDITQGQENTFGASADVSDWLKALRWCPRELVDLVNSKACRGAIMFNDSLTNEQCSRLVHQLSETVFPFQCAHGRPSLIPLANLGKLSGNSRSTRRRYIAWSMLEGQR